ncbi:hypothetical protein ANSO36C_67490 (plasmid) [Nostoc cf. commune SO-36]|uniref:Uncharacterized protein n=1 Tax=Nostoc cf. commune SO-36 TaxID=449208 RepID=A0ABM7ZCD3_NOSCO|nr:hypothetical protein [Nostoc commune]BDI20947.1 hypothetical protein ANSO36C_67490 [Nostoc cf. commune SO-36]
MSLTFREAKAQLEANNVGELRTILEQVGRPTTEPISTEDFEMLRVIYPLIKQGVSLLDALNSYNETPQNNVPAVNEMLNTLRQEFLASGVEGALRRDAKSFYMLYFQMWGDAMRSPEILNDPDIKAAYKGATISTLEAMQEINPTFLMSFRNRLRNKGFLPSVNQPQLIEAGIDTQEAA